MPNPLIFVGLIISITIHEFAHAIVADRLGDPTPRSQGRVSINPLRHLDPLGTLVLLIANFGWGKPVVIDPYNFRNPRRDEILVSLAGPLSNIILAIILSQASRFAPIPFEFVLVNLYLAVFNLLPVPPLDGSKILLNLLPENTAHDWSEAFDRYGFVILILLVTTGLIGSIITPIVKFITNLLF